jgi:hypothetical protein
MKREHPDDCLICDNEKLQARIEELTNELSEAEDKLCWHCTHPDSGLPERHEHEITGKGVVGHWHHYIDPGDCLPSPCKNSDLLEEIFKELTKERDAAWAKFQQEFDANDK